MLRSLSFGFTLVVIAQAVEASNPKRGSAGRSHVAVDADGEVHHVAARAQHVEQKVVEHKIEKPQPSKMAQGFNVRSSVVGVESPKAHKITGVREHKAAPPADKTVRADADTAAPTGDSAEQKIPGKPDFEPEPAPPKGAPPQDVPPQDAPPAESQTAAPPSAPSQEPAQQTAPPPAESSEAPTPAPAPAQTQAPAPSNPSQSLDAEAGADASAAAKVFVVALLVVAFFLVGFVMRERILELMPNAVQDAVYSARQQLGLETTLRESRPQGPRKKMSIERSESSQEYSSMRAAAYQDQSEYLSPVQSETSSASEGDVPVGRA